MLSQPSRSAFLPSPVLSDSCFFANTDCSSPACRCRTHLFPAPRPPRDQVLTPAALETCRHLPQTLQRLGDQAFHRSSSKRLNCTTSTETTGGARRTRLPTLGSGHALRGTEAPGKASRCLPGRGAPACSRFWKTEFYHFLCKKSKSQSTIPSAPFSLRWNVLMYLRVCLLQTRY